MTMRYMPQHWGGMMDWLHGEPKLDDILSDPVVQAIMTRDRIDPDGLRQFIAGIRRKRTELARYEAWASLVAAHAA
jgi:hypothetical protein